MKIDIILVHFAVIAAVAVPYILFILAAARQRNQLKMRFFQEARALNLNLNQIDRWNSNMIGVDKVHQKVLFVQRKKEEFFVQVIDLKSIKNCVLTHQVKTVKHNKKNNEILQKVELELSSYNGDPQSLSFFDCDNTYYEDYELLNAGKWSEIIQESIHLRPSVRSAA